MNFLSTIFIGIILFVANLFEVNFSDLVKDPATVTDTHPFVGMISNLGIILFAIAAAYSFFSYYLLRHSHLHKKSKQFLLVLGLFTTILTLDDLFLIHEYSFILGVSEKYIYLLYALLSIAFFLSFNKEILNIHKNYFFLAIVFFAISVLSDQFLYSDPSSSLKSVIEDGAKFLGIVNWMTFIIKTCMLKLQQCLII